MSDLDTTTPAIDSHDDPVSNVETAEDTISPSWAVSICFWCTLLVAVAVYASVALSPKLAVWNQVRHEYVRNAEELVSLEEDVDYLERVQTALQTDPEFVERLVGLTNPAAQDNEEFIPVSGSLLFGYDAEESLQRQIPEAPPYDGVVTAFATNRRLRTSLLSLSAFLTIFAFTFLNDAGTNLVQGAGRITKRIAMIPVKRYLTVNNRQQDGEEVQKVTADRRAGRHKSTAEISNPH